MTYSLLAVILISLGTNYWLQGFLYTKLRDRYLVRLWLSYLAGLIMVFLCLWIVNYGSFLEMLLLAGVVAIINIQLHRVLTEYVWSKPTNL